MSMNEKYPLALSEGTILAGQYTIEKVLGQGGFGITYKAKDFKTNQNVAVKEFFPDTLVYREVTKVISYSGERTENFEYGKQSFLQEAQTLAEFIGNENIVRIYSYFEENGTAYFVMDYIKGKSFDEYLKENGGKISVEQAKNILIPVMDALGAVHSKGIVHRDVTPDNIYITDEGKIMLLDFGAARYSLGDKSRSLDIILKHGFAPKEQYTRRGRQGAFTDIYSLGATFYFAITGKRPPDSVDRLDEDDLIPPSNLGVEITEYQEKAILQALNVQPADRFQSMAEFKHILLNENTATIPKTTAVNQVIFQPPPVTEPIPPPPQSVTTQTTTTQANIEKLKNFVIQNKKTSIGICVAVLAVIIGTSVGISSGKKVTTVEHENSEDVVDAFMQEESNIAVEITTTNATIIATDTTQATTKTTTKTTTATTTTTTTTSSENLKVLGNTSGNILNGGIFCYDDDGNKYFIGDDWHSINMRDTSGNVTVLESDENAEFSNLLHNGKTLYFIKNGKVCYREDESSSSHYIFALTYYDNIQKFYLTENYYFIYVSEDSGSGKLYRISKISLDWEQWIEIDYAEDFTISGGYLFYKTLGANGNEGIFKVPADNFDESLSWGYTDFTGSFTYPVIDNGYLYALYNSYGKKTCQIARFNIDTMEFDTYYDVSDLITDSSGTISQLNVKGNNIFFSFSDNSTNNYFSLYHIKVNGESYEKERVTSNTTFYPNIISYTSGNIMLCYMLKKDDSIFKNVYLTYDSEGNKIS